MRWGWALFGLFCLLFGGTVVVALRLPAGCHRRDLDHRARRRAAGPAARGQGSLRHGRRADDVRLGGLRRPRPAADGARRCGCSRRPAGRTSARRTCTSSPTASRRRTSTTGRCRTRASRAARRAARAAARRRRSSPGSPTARSAPTPAARSGSRPRAAGSPGFKPTYGLVPIDGVFPLAPSFDHAGPMARDVAGCVELMRRWCRVRRRSRRSRLTVASPGSTAATRSSRAAARRRRARAARRSTSRPRSRSRRRSCARSATSTASSTPSTASSTARTSRGKIERCLAVVRRRVRRPRPRARAEHAERARGGARGLRPAAHADAGVRRAAGRRRRDRGPRARFVALHVPVQRARLAGARAPGGGRLRSVQIVGRPGDDALVLGGRARAGASSNVGSVNADLEFAHELADAADAITLARFRALDLRVETKPDLTPVSRGRPRGRGGDPRARRRVGAGRGRARRGVRRRRRRRRRWIVDPIDGTTNYVRGVPVWATLLALEREGEVDVGLVSAPALGRRWWAIRGEGAFADGERCTVSAVARIEDSVGLDDVGAQHAGRLAQHRAARLVEPRARRLLAALPGRRRRARRRAATRR